MRVTLMLLACLAAAGASAGTVEVRFIEPDKFTDARDNLLRRDEVLDALAQHFKQLGGARLPAQQTLQVEVLDVDLAGDVFPRVAVHDVRVMRGRADWPRMHLRYTLREGDRELQRGEAQLADMAYQQSSLSPRHSGPYGYERRMLDRWFRETFAAPH
ncbi:MAG: DUF3016 domain-containing protein [Burkholderiales bacterium]|nr:DUF3016 domain-containing protein [Burkholderiales bacterium]